MMEQPRSHKPRDSFPGDALSAARWDEAFSRVESYLRAFGLESRVRLNQLTLEIVQEAQMRWEKTKSSSPVELSLQVTREKVDGWLNKLELPAELTNAKAITDARIALILADLPGRWSDYFLSTGPLPEPFLNSIGMTRVLPTPEMRVSSMPTAPLEFGSAEETELPSPPALKRAFPIPQAALVWMCILGLFGVVWAASH